MPASEQALAWLVQAPALEQTRPAAEQSSGRALVRSAPTAADGQSGLTRHSTSKASPSSSRRPWRLQLQSRSTVTGAERAWSIWHWQKHPPPPPWPKRPKCEHMQAGMTNSTRRFGRHLPSVQLDPGTKLSSLVSTAASPSSSCSLCDSKVISRALLEM